MTHARTVVTALLATLTSLGCNDLTSIDAPNVVQPADYTTAAGASALAIGATTHFTFTFGGFGAFGGSGSTHLGQVVMSGLMADELFYTDTGGGGLGQQVDMRDPVDPSLDTGILYTPLHSTRIDLLTAIAALQRSAPDSIARLGQLFALTGYTELFLGENFCAGVPLSRLDADFRPVYGQPLTSVQLYEQALADFDSALVYGADSLRIVQLARVGKGRVLLDLGRFSEAAEAVASVPTNYVYHAMFVTGTLHNGLVNDGAINPNPQRRYTVPEREGTNGLNWRSSGDTPGVYDPRTVLINRSPAVIGEDNSTEVWQFAGYQASNAPIRLASGIEARLIEAEAALQSGDASTSLNKLNELRALGSGGGGVDGLTPLLDPGSPAARIDLHFRERAFWLFLTGHRHGDLRRLVRQYGRNAETVFPTGIYRDVTYGTATNMAPPTSEFSNPNYSGCLNRDA